MSVTANASAAELACRATWRRCARDFDFFTEYMTEVALAGHGSGQDSAEEKIRALEAEAARLREKVSALLESMDGDADNGDDRMGGAWSIEAEDALRAAIEGSKG